jgi:hypothetical protein
MTMAYIVTKCPKDAEILKKILPESLVQSVLFVNGESEYGAESMARKLLSSKRSPVVLVMDAKTNDAALIEERSNDLGFLMRQAAGGVPFKMAIAIPEIEVVFFHDRSLLEAMIQQPLTDLEWQLAQHHPKDLLEILPSGVDGFVEAAINDMSDSMIQTLHQHPLIQEIIRFLSHEGQLLRSETSPTLAELYGICADNPIALE